MRAIVTGANRGIGLELCRQLAGRQAEVWALCRTSSPELLQLGVQVVDRVDVQDLPSLEKVAVRIGSKPVDLLINNAGLLLGDSLSSLDFEAITRQFEVNALGPLKATRAFLPLLGSGAKIALITSRMGSVADNTSGGSYGYRMSKAALNMAGASLAHDLRHRGISVALLHPGYVKTGMTGGHGSIHAPEAASLLLQRIDELSLATSGTFWHANGERLPW